jgi:hypothetical protein
MTTNEQITKETYDRNAKNYTDHTNQTMPHIRALLDSDIDYVVNIDSQNQNKKVLIVGAGDARDGLIFLGKSYTAICNDYSKSMKEIAIKNGFPSSHYLCEDIRDCVLESDFSIIWASTVLYHINRDDLKNSIFNKFFNSLIDKGILYFNLFLGEGEVLEEVPISFRGGGSRFYTYYQRDEILSVVVNAGFNILHEYVSDLFEKKFIRIIAQR